MRKKAILVTLFLGGLALVAVRLFIPYDSLADARERLLRQDLYIMRSALDQYTLDKQKRPQSLDDLVNAGYFKQLPKDPITGRNDTWVVEWSRDSKTPGIVDIRSGSLSISSNGTAYASW